MVNPYRASVFHDSQNKRTMNILWLGKNQPYSLIYQQMKTLLHERINEQIPDTLMLVEHEPTYTLGRARNAENNVLDPRNTPVIRVERGGDVTYHGTGQLTGYPIVRLPAHKQDILAYLRFLEEFWIQELSHHGIQGTRDERNTGVWVDGKKIVAIGVALRRWVCWHGFACNISTDLTYFQRINPCGMDASLVTRMIDYQVEIDLEDFASHIGRQFKLAWESWCIENKST